MSLTSHSQKPATSSRVSVKGPSMTVRLGPSKATRLPFAEGCRPSPANMMPALTSSSLYLPMASRSSVEGMVPASLSLVAFTRTITRIVLSPLIHQGRTGLLAHTTNELRRDRHPAENFLREMAAATIVPSLRQVDAYFHRFRSVVFIETERPFSRKPDSRFHDFDHLLSSRTPLARADLRLRSRSGAKPAGTVLRARRKCSCSVCR